MQILFLTDPVPDYLADLLYSGLVRVLGQESVVDFPLKPAYHDPEHRVHYIPQVRAHAFQEDDICGLLQAKRFDFVICSSPRPGALKSWKALRNRVLLPPVIFLDGEDDASIRVDVWKGIDAVLYFKRELLAGRRHASCTEHQSRLYPLQLSVSSDHLGPDVSRTRDVDVSYVARVSHPKRKRVVELLATVPGLRFEGGVYAESTDRQSKVLVGLPRLWAKLRGDPPVTPEQRGVKLSHEAYSDLLTRSKMGLSVRGGGFDTLRYWEVPATRTVLLSERPDIEIPNNFVHGEQALFFNPDLSDLVELVQAYVKEEAVCAAIAERGYEHTMRYHTCERRAEQFLAICKQSI